MSEVGNGYRIPIWMPNGRTLPPIAARTPPAPLIQPRRPSYDMMIVASRGPSRGPYSAAILPLKSLFFAAPMVAAPEAHPEPHVPASPDPMGLVVGSYCHDVLFRNGAVVGESLGGAASFISNVFEALDRPLHLRCRYVSKVGLDFAHGGRPCLPTPSSSSCSPTTVFHAHFASADTGNHGDRLLRRVRACDAIFPRDIPSEDGPFDFGLAVGVAGEISPATLSRMIDLCRIIFVDAQALIRTFDPSNGTVHLVRLRDSGFSHLLPRIGFLKAAADEAPFLDLDHVRQHCCVVITDGKDGCTVYWRSGELRLPSFPAVQVDPTGAGDSFLGGFVYGIVRGLPVPDAALLGNLLGSLTVRQMGIPQFTQELFQGVREEIDRRRSNDSVGEAGSESGSLHSILGSANEATKESGSFHSILAEAAGRFSIS